MLLAVEKGRYFFVIAASRRLHLPKPRSGPVGRSYDRFLRYDLGPVDPDVGRAVAWQLNVCWSFRNNGIGKTILMKDGKTIVNDKGANCFNDLRGAPYFKFGVYQWGRWRTARKPQSNMAIRRTYADIAIHSDHRADRFRIA